MESYIAEVVMGLVMGGFAWAFQAWARTLRTSTAKIMDKLDAVGRELGESQIMLARLDERIKKLEKCRRE